MEIENLGDYRAQRLHQRLAINQSKNCFDSAIIVLLVAWFFYSLSEGQSALRDIGTLIIVDCARNDGFIFHPFYMPHPAIVNGVVGCEMNFLNLHNYLKSTVSKGYWGNCGRLNVIGNRDGN